MNAKFLEGFMARVLCNQVTWYSDCLFLQLQNSVLVVHIMNFPRLLTRILGEPSEKYAALVVSMLQVFFFFWVLPTWVFQES